MDELLTHLEVARPEIGLVHGWENGGRRAKSKITVEINLVGDFKISDMSNWPFQQTPEGWTPGFFSSICLILGRPQAYQPDPLQLVNLAPNGQVVHSPSALPVYMSNIDMVHSTTEL